MDSKYNKFKEGLGSEKKAVPPELAWENMQEGVYEKMHNLKRATRTRRRLFIGTITGIIMLLLIKFVCTPGDFRNTADFQAGYSEKQPVAAPQSQLGDPSNKIEKASIPLDGDAEDKFDGIREYETINEKGTNKQFDLQNNSDLADSTATNSGNKTLAINNRQSPQALPGKDIVLGSHSIAESADEPDNVATPNNKNSITGLGESIERNDDGTKKNSNYLPSIPLVSLIQNEIVYKPQIADAPDLYFPISSEAIKSKKGDSPQNRISLMGGVTHWSMGFGTFKPERDDFERTVTSVGSSLSYIHRFSNNLELLVGIQYTKLESRFDYMTEIDNYTVILKDTLIQVQSNFITGKQSFVRGDVEVPVNAQRIIRHYNTVQLVQIPLAVGRNWTQADWAYGLYAGATMNISTSQSGRTYYEAGIFDYSGRNTEFINNSWKLHAMLSGRVSYAINERFALSSQFQVQKSVMNWSLENDVSMKPVIYSLSFGIDYIL